MRLATTLTLASILAINAACSSDKSPFRMASEPQAQTESAAAPANGQLTLNKTVAGKGDNKSGSGQTATKAVSLNDAEKAANTPITQRKIIKNAELTLQSGDPEEGARRVEAAAAAKGGFVVTSEAKDYGGGRTVIITARVPSEQFDAFIAEARGFGVRVLSERTTGQDVTEEFIDLEARIRVQKETEARYLDFLKQAKGVEEALTVQRELSNVRTQIEQLEGRKRFLESQSSLSTVTVTLQPEASIVTTSPTGFWHDVKLAFADGFSLATNIILFLIRAVIVLTPLMLFVFLPLGWLLRLVWRRTQKSQAAPPEC